MTQEKIGWYIIRKKGTSRWDAYQLRKIDIDRLQPQYEYCGPFKSLVECLIKQAK